MKISIRKATANDEASWRRLWEDYVRFNNNAPSKSLSRINWSRIMDESAPIYAAVAVKDRRRVIGTANYVLHESTWTVSPVCYLSDLFIEPRYRSAGVGRLLMDWLIDETRV
jgi:GNAT superfamily N-acetyltransferase